MAGVIARHGPLTIRRLRDEQGEYDRMARWRNQPHVREWWDPDEPPLTAEQARGEYGPDTQADSLTIACVIEEDDRPAGFIQFYRWSSYSEEAETVGIPFDDNTWGLDIFIGEPQLVGHGLGSTSVGLLCRYLFEQRGASAVALAASKDNERALRAYEKAGFRRTVSVLDLDTRQGERIESWLMVRQRDS